MSSSSPFPIDQLPPSEQLCYVHCNLCDTVLAVSVPCTSLFKTVTVRCGHCTNLLSVNMRGLLLPAANQLQLGHAAFFSPPNNLLAEMSAPPPPSLLINQTNQSDCMASVKGGANEHPKMSAVNRRNTLLSSSPLCYFSS